MQDDSARPEHRAPELLTVRSVADVFASPPQEPPVIVEGLLRAGEMCVVGSLRGIGKTWWGYNLADLVGRGDGRLAGTLEVKAKARVLYCQGELTEWDAFDRWRRLTGQGDPPAGVDETFDRWRIRISKRRVASSHLDSREFVEAVMDPRLEATISAGGYGVLVIDPWRSYFAGSENSNDDTEAALDQLRGLCLRYGLAVVILAHVGKSTDAREPEDLWRGASRLADWASTRVTLLPHYTEKEATAQGMTRQQARRYVDVRFLRRGAPTDDFSARWNPETGWWERWQPQGRPPLTASPEWSPERVAEVCRHSGGSWKSIREAAKALGVSPETAKGLLAMAVEAGALERVAGPRKALGYVIPDGRLPGV